MSRWDPEPTSFQRWIVRHRTEIRVGAVLVMVVAISAAVYDLVTAGLTLAVGGPIVGIAASFNFLLTTREVSGFLEKYDSARDQGPRSG